MQPNDPHRGQIQPPQRPMTPGAVQRASTPVPSQQPISVPQPQVQQSSVAQRESVANIARANIDQIYQGDPAVHAPAIPQQETSTAPASMPQQPQPASVAPAIEQLAPTSQQQQTTHAPTNSMSATQAHPHTDNPYERVHNEDHLVASDDKWKTYHSAWQNYYQQYFYRYYAGHLSQKDAEVRAAHAVAEHAKSQVEKASQAVHSKESETLTQEEAVDTLRGQIRSKINTSAKKVRKSRHFKPIIAGLSVMLIFLALQYNTQIVGAFAGFITPGSIDPNDIIVDTSIDVPVGDESRLIIPKINVNEPIIWDAANDAESQLKAMEDGVAYFGVPGANSKPGQVGNTPLAAHSANNLLESGSHKFVFVHLPNLVNGDLVYITYNGVRYIYKVTEKEEVQPNDVASLVYDGDKPVITLITCVPVGHSSRRLLVTAEQISPDPSSATAASTTTTETSEPAEMTGNSPTLLDRIFGG